MESIKPNSNWLNVLLVAVFFTLQACTGFQAHPKVARKGDTISIAVGSAVGMTKAVDNTTAVYNSDAGGSYPLTIRSVFNLYPDKKSRLYQNNSDTIPLVNSSDHEAWQTVMVLDLPTNLPVGTGNIQITSSAEYPPINSHINDMQVSLEIIDGTGTANAFDYEFGVGSLAAGDLSLLEPLPHALITPPKNNEFYGAIEIKFTLNTSATYPLTDQQVRLILDDIMPATESHRNVIWNIIDDEIVVILISPSGFLQVREARLSVVLKSKFSFISPPIITAVTYFDVNGNAVTGPITADYTVTLN